MSSTRAPSIALAAALLAAIAQPAHAVEREWRLTVELGPGFDANALRVVGDTDPSSSGFTGGALRLHGRLAGDRWSLDGRWSEGFRLFMGEGDADLLASRLELGARWAVSERIEIGADGMGRDLVERGGARDLREGRVGGRVALTTGRVRWGVAGGWAVSAPRAAGLEVFRRYGPELALSSAVRIARDHALVARYVFDAWRYEDWPGGRDDDEHAAGLEWSWDGPALLGLGYTFGRNASTVPGGSWRRHRVTARVASDLPFGLDLAARATVQRSVHPSGVILSEQLSVREGDESQNSVEVQLARPLRSRLDLALKVAHYRSELGAEAALEFRRTIAQISLAWSLGD